MSLKSLTLSLAVWAGGILPSSGAFAFDHAHAAWTQVLAKYQDAKGLIRYAALKADVKADAGHLFPAYLKSLESVSKADFDAWPKPRQMAFLINAYNAFTVKLIVDNYPVASIKKIGGLFTKPWDVTFFSLLDGQVKSLDPIEHKMLRPQYKDYRVHAAVNCASLSCPPLRHEAFTGDALDAQLDDQMAHWLADPSRNRYEPEAGKLLLSKIFDWYKKDFVEYGGGVEAVVKKHGPDAARKALAKKGDIDYLDYDWSLNEAK